MPVRLRTTRKDELCYEPFSGSGSQLIAGEQLGRRVYGMEISPAYCDVIVMRWQGLGGERRVVRVWKGKEKDVTEEMAAREVGKTDAKA